MLGGKNYSSFSVLKLELQHADCVFDELVRVKDAVHWLSWAICFVAADNLLGEVKERVQAWDSWEYWLTIRT